jgi:hypothetical protein
MNSTAMIISLESRIFELYNDICVVIYYVGNIYNLGIQVDHIICNGGSSTEGGASIKHVPQMLKFVDEPRYQILASLAMIACPRMIGIRLRR